MLWRIVRDVGGQPLCYHVCVVPPPEPAMPRSMTAFARVAAQYSWGTLTWELRSVNHRFLEPHFRLPETLRELEMPLREQLRGHLERGKIDANLQLELDRRGGSVVNLELARQCIQASDAIAALCANPAPVNPMDILRWPGVLEEPGVDNAAVQKEALALFAQALAQLVDMRAREGGKLADLIAGRLAGIEVEIARVRSLLPQLLNAQRQKLRDRLGELTAAMDHDRLEQELVYSAQRADVDEELDRLASHVAEVRVVLASGAPVGRKLDFLMQEFNREANTLASKSLAIATTQAAVAMKMLIEQMREQIQNLE